MATGGGWPGVLIVAAVRSNFLLRLLQQRGMYWSNAIVDYNFAEPEVRGNGRGRERHVDRRQV
jgi:hypothetical protein